MLQFHIEKLYIQSEIKRDRVSIRQEGTKSKCQVFTEENWMKSVLGLNILLKSPSDALHTSQGVKVFCFWKEILKNMWIWTFFDSARNVCVITGSIFGICNDLGGFVCHWLICMIVISACSMNLGWVGRASDCSASVACPFAAACAVIALYFVTQTIFLSQILRFWTWSIVLSLSENAVFLDKDRAVDNIQKHNIHTNVTLSWTFRSYLFSYQIVLYSVTLYQHSCICIVVNLLVIIFCCRLW